MQIGQFQQNKFELSNSRVLAKGCHNSEKMSPEGKSAENSKGEGQVSCPGQLSKARKSWGSMELWGTEAGRIHVQVLINFWSLA